MSFLPRVRFLSEGLWSKNVEKFTFENFMYKKPSTARCLDYQINQSDAY
jgi:hypothetical protein